MQKRRLEANNAVITSKDACATLIAVQSLCYIGRLVYFANIPYYAYIALLSEVFTGNY